MSEDKNLRKAGLKVTLPRVRILEIFEQSSERHLSAEDIYNKIREAGDEVGLATVYRVLTQFESAGILMKQNFEDNYSVYELVSEDHHDHMVCIDSGAVIEFKNDLIEELNNVCEECKKEDESVRQNLILTGFKLCKSCRTSKTIFPI